MSAVSSVAGYLLTTSAEVKAYVNYPWCIMAIPEPLTASL
jgi:hypothetical protein